MEKLTWLRWDTNKNIKNKLAIHYISSHIYMRYVIVVHGHIPYMIKIFTNIPNIHKRQQVRNIKLQNNLVTYIFIKSLWK